MNERPFQTPVRQRSHSATARVNATVSAYQAQSDTGKEGALAEVLSDLRFMFGHRRLALGKPMLRD